MRFAWLALVAVGCSAAPIPATDSNNDPPAVPPSSTGSPPSTTHGPTNAANAPGTWIAVHGGTFVMSRATDACRGPNEKEHTVTLAHDFEMAATEVSQADYGAVMGTNPSHWTDCGKDCPADSIHWHMAAAFTNALSERTGATPCYACTGSGASVRCVEAVSSIQACLGYRLPTEAEWEYAYRETTSTTLYDGPLGVCSGMDDNLAEIAWYRPNAEAHSHPSRSKAPNAWGFYDMSGNLWEWMSDGFIADLGSAQATDPVGASGATRSVRGGSYNCEANEVRGGHRTSLPPSAPGLNVGFRPARTLQ